MSLLYEFYDTQLSLRLVKLLKYGGTRSISGEKSRVSLAKPSTISDANVIIPLFS
jgi:hypothetical protein